MCFNGLKCEDRNFFTDDNCYFGGQQNNTMMEIFQNITYSMLFLLNEFIMKKEILIAKCIFSLKGDRNGCGCREGQRYKNIDSQRYMSILI